jgi:hypothetical protein
VTYDRLVREAGHLPTSTGVRVPLELAYFDLGGIDYTLSAQNKTDVLLQQVASASRNMAQLLHQLGAYGGFNASGGTWDGPCLHCKVPLSYMQPGAPYASWVRAARHAGRCARVVLAHDIPSRLSCCVLCV